MSGLKDIGGGVGIVDVAPLVSQALQVRQLMGQEKAREADAERNAVGLLKDKADLILKKNDVDNINFANEAKRVDLNIKKFSEHRAQSDDFTKRLKELPGLFALSPEMGAMAAKQDGFQSVVNKDGTVTLMHSPDGKFNASKVFTIDPMGVDDPEKKITMERPFRQDWEKKAAPYATISSAFNNMKALAADNTGTSDIGILYSYIKVLDPNSAVKEGEIALANQATNVPQWIMAKYNKAVQDGAPAFSPEQRVRFVQSAGRLYDTARTTIIRDAKNTAEIVEGSKLRSRMVVTPVGDVSLEDIFGKDTMAGDAQGAPKIDTVPAGLLAPKGKTKTKAQEATLVPGQNEAPAPGPEVIKPVRVEDTLKNLFGRGR